MHIPDGHVRLKCPGDRCTTTVVGDPGRARSCRRHPFNVLQPAAS